MRSSQKRRRLAGLSLVSRILSALVFELQMLLRSSKLTLAVLTSFAIGITANSVALAGSSTLKPKSSELSPSVLGMEESSHGYEPGDEKAKKPGEFDLGGNTLHIDADKKDIGRASCRERV